MSKFNQTTVSLRTAALMAFGAVGIFCGGMYVARATPGGEVRKGLSFAGTLSGVDGKQKLTFVFKKDMGTTTVCSVESEQAHESGPFVAELLLDKAGCPTTLFDGSDVTYDVKFGSDVTLAANQPVNPVPYARYADQVGAPDCPVGYVRDLTAPGFETGSSRILCVNRQSDGRDLDSVVRVGQGPSSFWIDRWEARIHNKLAADGTQLAYGGASDDYPAEFPDNGQWKIKLFAVSRRGNLPSRYVTWFQASEACRAAGKRLPTGVEWMTAASGTLDTGASDGSAGKCLTMGAVRDTGLGTACFSRWGAEDMIGNVWEWTEEWFAGVGQATAPVSSWTASYAGDSIENLSDAKVHREDGPFVTGLPAAAIRGGGNNDFAAGANPGVFALSVAHAPSDSAPIMGFRCIIPR